MEENHKEIRGALVHAVCDMLKRNESAAVPGLGTFRVKYVPSRCKRDPEGNIMIIPPKREIVFTPADADATVAEDG